MAASQTVSGSPDSEDDMGLGGIVLDFFPQTPDVYVQCVVVDDFPCCFTLVSAFLFRCNDVFWVVDEDEQQAVFQGREEQFFPVF